MADEKFLIVLDGQRFELPRLPWRIAKEVTPRLMRHAGALVEGNPGTIGPRLDEATLSELTEALALALQVAAPEMTVDRLGEMVFGVHDLALALGPVLAACGLGTGVPPVDPPAAG